MLPISGLRLGPRFDGIGALSGGGATSRLLQDYENNTLFYDLLFKAFYGASLHLLKTEIGSATFTGCGTEPSHAYEVGDLSYSRGYEWELMRAGLSRNPSLLYYGLSWGFPGWIAEGSEFYPLTQNQVEYTLSFLEGVRKIGFSPAQMYQGVWNEMSWSVDYVVQLRNGLDAMGFEDTKVVVADDALSSENPILAAMEQNASFADAVFAIGVHYPTASNATPAALASNRTLWSSEDSSTFFDSVGGGCWGRILNWNPLYGNYTATIMWNLITSYYAQTRWYGDSLFAAARPWDGSYNITSPLWITAHWTQFVFPGYHFLPRGSGQGELPGGGTYVTYVEPVSWLERAQKEGNGSRKEVIEGFLQSGKAFLVKEGEEKGEGVMEWVMVIETMTREHSLCIRNNPSKDWEVAAEQNVSIQIGEELVVPEKVVVWKSALFSTPQVLFERQPDIMVGDDGKVYLPSLQPDEVWTIASVDSGQTKGAVPPSPPQSPFPHVWSDDFESYPLEATVKYWADQSGVFGTALEDSYVHEKRGGGRVLLQNVTTRMIDWHTPAVDTAPGALSITAEAQTTDVTIEADVSIVNESTVGPSGDPLLSLRPCDSSAKDQLWTWSDGGDVLLHSLMNALTSQCMDVYGCDTNPGTAAWMWECVNTTKTNCESKNQQWEYKESTKTLITAMSTGFCLTSSNPTTTASLTLNSCTSSSLLQQWKSIPTTSSSTQFQFSLAANQSLCLSSLQPPSQEANATWVGMGGRLGGFSSRGSQQCEAYASTWLEYGYFCTVQSDGFWSITAGKSPASQKGQRLLESGVVEAPQLGSWHHMQFSVRNNTITCAWDGAVLGMAIDAKNAFVQGWGGITTGFHHALFDNLTITSTTLAQ